MRETKIVIIVLMVLSAGAFVPRVSFALDVNIGVVNFALLLDESPQAKAAMGLLQKEFEPRQRTLQAQEEELRKSGEEIERDLEIMSESQRVSAEKEFRDERRELTRKRREYMEDFELRRNEELGRLQQELLSEVQNYAQSNQFDLIIGDGVVYASDQINITPQILERLKSKN